MFRSSRLWHQLFAATLGGCGLFIIWKGSEYSFGSLANIGPGFFPVTIGIGITLVSVVIFLIDRRTDDTQIELQGRPIILVVISVLLFALMIERFGLLPSAIVMTAVAAYADQSMSVRTSIVVVLFVTCVAVGLFHFGFNIPAPLFRGY